MVTKVSLLNYIIVYNLANSHRVYVKLQITLLLHDIYCIYMKIIYLRFFILYNSHRVIVIILTVNALVVVRCVDVVIMNGVEFDSDSGE